jgi:phosphatidylethanolamine-binding protein (PEBP) family uncharacterized protein
MKDHVDNSKEEPQAGRLSMGYLALTALLVMTFGTMIVFNVPNLWPSAHFLSFKSSGDSSSYNFKLISSTMVDGGSMPIAYTCLASDGGISPPLKWKNPPADTYQYILLMETDSYRHDGVFLTTRCDWAIYGIPATSTAIKAGNAGGIGVPGGTYPGDEMHIYNPPCPSGSGNKTYYFTVYALSGDLTTVITDDEGADTGPNLVAAAEDAGMILDTAKLSVSFCKFSDSQEQCTEEYIRESEGRS